MTQGLTEENSRTNTTKRRAVRSSSHAKPQKERTTNAEAKEEPAVVKGEPPVPSKTKKGASPPPTNQQTGSPAGVLPEERVTRQFGLVPIPRCPRCLTLGTELRGENDQKVFWCPACQKRLEDAPPGLPKDFFSRFAQVVNVMVRRGLMMPYKGFRADSLQAVKRFHDRIKNDPKVDEVVQAAGLHNRLRRCAAQYAYIILQEYHRRKRGVTEIARVLKDHLKADYTWQELLDPSFPSRALVEECRGQLFAHLGSAVPLETTFLTNLVRHVRNLLWRMVVDQASDVGQSQEFPVPQDITQVDVLVQHLQATLPDQAASFLPDSHLC